jgi:heterotetrameric sarcosine oxidase alpha subunit
MAKLSNRADDGGRIDRTKRLTFSFDGRNYTGYSGDTLASAMLANGLKLVGRSFKYHRPRGIYSAGIEEPNALVSLDTGSRQEPNIPATVIELRDGLVAKSQNRWPSLNVDVMSIVGLFSKALSAGFYYKTFMGPTRKSWMFYEHFIRKAAGLGDAPSMADPDHYEKSEAFCDVMVVGAGPSGLMAALAAGRDGARVILVEDDFELGGSLLSRSRGGQSDAWLAAVIGELASISNVRIMKRTCVFGAYDNRVFGMVERVCENPSESNSFQPRQRFWIVRARQVILATGMIERPLIFGNNDLPGTMLASASRTYANRYAVNPGKRVAVFTNNNSAYDVAIDLSTRDCDITIIDIRREIDSGLIRSAWEAGIELHQGYAVSRANGGKCVRSIDVMELDYEQLRPSKLSFTLPCDALLVSGGWSPVLHLLSQRGSKLAYDERRSMFVAGSVPEGFHLAGAAALDLSLSDCASGGERAGHAASQACEFVPRTGGRTPLPDMPNVEGDLDTAPLWEVPHALGSKPAKKFVDFQNDVKSEDISLAYREGYDSVELLKRYTTLGMATDQGKTANLNALAILAAKHGLNIKEVGTTTFRPPYRPITIGALAGQQTNQHFMPTRRSPMHHWHENNGAVFTQTNLWVRPWYFPQPGESMQSASNREAANVRRNVGIVDVSSLGKIDVQGPDVAEFLNRVYVNNWDTLKIGKARYGVMLRPDGVVFDDGTTSRISENHYFMTTTTVAEGKVTTNLEFLLQTAWPDLRVQVTNVTSQWAAMAVAGPQSRDVLSRTFADVDFSNSTFPFMGIQQGHLGDIPVRLVRLSFSGELAYEVYTPAGYGQQVWQGIVDAGQEYGIAPYGTEALNILRIEKGHVAGPELDGRTNLGDLGMGRMASKKKPFIGRTLMQREGMVDDRRPQLVGLEAAGDAGKLRAGAILCEQGHHNGHGLGFVSSVAYSPELAKNIGLAFVAGGLSRRGEVIDAVFPLRGEVSPVRIVSPHFVDPDGERLNV